MFNVKSNFGVLSKEDFRLFQQLILKEGGMHFNEDQRKSFSLTIVERVQATNKKSFREYYNFIVGYHEGRNELLNLLDLVTVGETSFFRTPAHFDVLREFILPDIVQRKLSPLIKTSQDENLYFAKPPIRIWSAGSSTGEEPYSVAITVLESIPQAAWAASILTTDINRERIAQAREGLYKNKTVQKLEPRIIEKYFTQAGNTYRIKDNVKSLVRFMKHNLTKEDFSSEYMQDLDIIICRNVLIYFDLPTIKEIIDKFYSCLNDDGHLILGPAESLWNVSSKFNVVEFPHAYIYKKGSVSREESEKPFINIPELNFESIVSAESVCQTKEELVDSSAALAAKEKFEVKQQEEFIQKCVVEYHKGIKLFKEKQYAEAIKIFDTIIKRNPEFIQAYFIKATILSNQAKYTDAVSELEKIIKVDNLFIEAYYLMGVLFDRLGNLSQAAVMMQKVIYIDPDTVLAHFNLANIASCRDRFRDAKREFNNAIDILERKPEDEIVTFSEDVNTQTLLTVCKKNLEAMELKHGAR